MIVLGSGILGLGLSRLFDHIARVPLASPVLKNNYPRICHYLWIIHILLCLKQLVSRGEARQFTTLRTHICLTWRPVIFSISHYFPYVIPDDCFRVFSGCARPSWSFKGPRLHPTSLATLPSILNIKWDTHNQAIVFVLGILHSKSPCIPKAIMI